MTTLHLSEPELQQAAEATPLPAAPLAHLRTCPYCQTRVAAYQRVFEVVARLPRPAFAFDVAALVAQQLPAPRPGFPWLVWLLGALVTGVVALGLATLGADIAQIFRGLAGLTGPALLAGAGCILAGCCLELLARHRRQLRQLALS